MQSSSEFLLAPPRDSDALFQSPEVISSSDYTITSSWNGTPNGTILCRGGREGGRTGCEGGNLCSNGIISQQTPSQQTANNYLNCCQFKTPQPNALQSLSIASLS